MHGVLWSRRVLVAIDDPVARSLCRIALEQKQYLVDEATDGLQALAHLRASPHRLVAIVGVQLPVIDGVQVLRAVAMHASLARRHAYIVFLPRTQPLSPLAASLCECLRMPRLTKPFSVERLLAVVAEAAAHLQTP